MTTNEPGNGQDGMQKTVDLLIGRLLSGDTVGNIAGLEKKELEAVYAVGHNYFASRKYDKAIDLFRFLCVYDHIEPRWFYSLGVALQAKGEFLQAVQSFAAATLLDTADPSPQVQAGYCLAALGRNQEAVSALEGAVTVCGGEAKHSQSRQQAETLLKKLRASNKES